MPTLGDLGDKKELIIVKSTPKQIAKQTIYLLPVTTLSLT